MSFDKVLFRASACHLLMTEPREKAAKERGDLSETTKTYLIEKYVNIMYGREKDITSAAIEKGLAVEEDAITLYSRINKKFYEKNTERLQNDYTSGEVDLYVGSEIRKADETIDTKASWDLFTYFKSRSESLNPAYYWQGQVYMALAGAKIHRVAFCLINTPTSLIDDAKHKLYYKMGVVTTENPDYLKACDDLEKSMVYDDIPMRERMFEKIVERNDADIERLYAKILKCRAHLNELEVKFNGVPILI